jgi:DNA modification methylase
MTPHLLALNTLFYGDNLDILRNQIPDESVDLIYLDPPFNSNANYNVLFKDLTGEKSQSQIEAFEDTWHWNENAELAFDQTVHNRFGNADVANMIIAMHGFLGKNDLMAYLAMMAVRLLELHRVLKPTGSIYLHCDPTASHYLKILLDAVFGHDYFRNEITWKRTSAHSDGNRYGRNTDIIFFYTKSDVWLWNSLKLEYDQKWIDRFRYKDEDGRLWRDADLSAKGLTGGGYTYDYKGIVSLWRVPFSTMERLDVENRLHFTKNGGLRLKRYLDEAQGYPLQSLWEDISPINSQSKERLGYPTQKPVALLERILAASSNEGDVVLDPFCGCGTTVHAAQKMGRRWIGIDITHLAIGLIRRRLIDAFPQAQFDIVGVPKDVAGARDLAARDKYQFQLWALSLLDHAQPWKGGKKGGDGGVDGYLFFKPDGKNTEKAVISVKGGANIKPAEVRDLGFTVDRERAKMGFFITLEDPTVRMRQEAAAAGLYKTEYGTYAKVQILTIEELLEGKKPHMPWVDASVFKKAKREKTETQNELNL